MSVTSQYDPAGEESLERLRQENDALCARLQELQAQLAALLDDDEGGDDDDDEPEIITRSDAINELQASATTPARRKKSVTFSKLGELNF